MAPLRPLPDMALSLQASVHLAAYTISAGEGDDALLRSWVDEQFRRLEPVTAGQYLGDLDSTDRRFKFMAE